MYLGWCNRILDDEQYMNGQNSLTSSCTICISNDKGSLYRKLSTKLKIAKGIQFPKANKHQINKLYAKIFN